MLNPLQPYFYLLLYVALVYLRLHEYPDFSTELPIVAITLVTAFVFWLIGTKKSFQVPQYPILVLFAFVMALSVALNGWIGGAFQVIGEFLPIVVLFFITGTSINSVPRLRQMFFVIVAATVVMALDGVHEANTGVGWSGAMPVEDGRITYLGFFNDPNDLSTAFLMALPMAIYLAASVPRFRFLAKAGGIVVGMLFLYGTYLTNSRGAYLAVIAMSGLFFSLRYGSIRSIFFLSLVILPLLLVPSRLDTISADEESAEGRIEAWYAGFDMFIHNPIFGVGKGNFTEHNYLTAHNSFVLVYAETGLVGYFLWLSLIVLSYIMLIRVRKLARRADIPAVDLLEWQDHRRIADTLLVAFTGFLAACMFLSRSYVLPLYLLLAMIVAEYEIVRMRWPELVARVNLRPIMMRMAGLAFGSIFFFYLLTKILLSLS